MSSSQPNSPHPITLADTFLNELAKKTGNPFPSMSETADRVTPGAASSSPSSNTGNPCSNPVGGASGPETKTGDPEPRYYLVMSGGDKVAALGPETVQVVNVTEVIPKACMLKAVALCTGVAFNYNFAAEKYFKKAGLCVIGSREEPMAVIDLDMAPNSRVSDREMMQALVNTQAMKAMLSSVKELNLAEFMGRVGEYVGNKFGDQRKAEYLKMVETWTPSGLGSFDSVEIWHVLTLKDRVMEAVMESVKLALSVNMPAIAIDMPSASVSHPTPVASGWKPGRCNIPEAEGSNPRPCNIPDLNQVVVDLLV